MIKNHKKTILALTAIILIFFGYWYFFLSKKDKNESSSALVATNSAKSSATPVSAYDKEFVSNLQTVRYIDLNTEIFKMPAYKALSFPEVPFEVDYNIPVGRRNPFLPIGTESPANSSAPQQPAAQVATTTVQATTTGATSTSTPTPKPKPRPAGR